MAKRDMERNLDEAFSLAHQVIEEPDAFPDDFVVFPLGDEVVFELLTAARLEILRTVRDEGPFESIADLARRLDRDPSRVSRDLGWLVEAGLIRLQEKGRSKRLQGTDRQILLA